MFLAECSREEAGPTPVWGGPIPGGAIGTVLLADRQSRWSGPTGRFRDLLTRGIAWAQKWDWPPAVLREGAGVIAQQNPGGGD